MLSLLLSYNVAVHSQHHQEGLLCPFGAGDYYSALIANTQLANDTKIPATTGHPTRHYTSSAPTHEYNKQTQESGILPLAGEKTVNKSWTVTTALCKAPQGQVEQ